RDAFASRDYEAPQGEIEVALAEIWAEMLRIDIVGRHDNFFMLGGHSLLAVQIIGRIRANLGVEMKIRAFFESPTISSLAMELGRGGDDDDDSYEEDLLAVIIPLRARGLNGIEPVAESIEAMVMDYIHQLRRIQPHGPYQLLGWSFGGNIAHTMAAELERMGDKVDLLVVLDSKLYSKEKQEEEVALGERSLMEAGLATLESVQQLTKGIAENDSNKDSKTLSRDWNLAIMEDRKAAMVQNWKHVVMNIRRLTKEYPSSIFTGHMMYFLATIPETTGWALLDPFSFDPSTHGGITVQTIDCRHGEMGLPENMAEIGRLLSSKLEGLYQHQLKEKKK
ncbi:hypothetical protein BGZ83_004215, partial [Gryganskiella cystojenkinii]